MATRPASSGTLTRTEPAPSWVEDARRLWTDVNVALDEAGRAPGRSGQRFSQTRVRDALRRAARQRPSWFSIQPLSSQERELAPFDITPREQREEPDPADAMTRGHGLDVVEGYEDEGSFLVGDRGAMTPTQQSELERRARAALREVQAAARHAREYARTEATQAGRDLATATENGLTAIARPLSLAFATATGPAQRGAGLGLGLGLVLAALILLK